jgi:hypothetical protein
MSKPPSIAVDPKPATGMDEEESATARDEEEFEGVRVTLVRINDPY